MKITTLTKSLLTTSVLIASLNAQAALITFDFASDGTNTLESTYTSGGYTLEVEALDNTDADAIISFAGAGLGVAGGGNGNRIGGGDNITFTLLGGDSFDFINVLFTDAGSSALLDNETAGLLFSDGNTETITGPTTSFTSQTVDATSFNIEGISGNGFRLLGLELNIIDTITIPNPVSSVPEPTTLAIFSLALAGLFSRKLKR